MSAPLVFDLPHTAYTFVGVRPVTLNTHANVWLNCPQPNPLPFMVPVALTHVSLLASSNSIDSGAASMQFTCRISPICGDHAAGGSHAPKVQTPLAAWRHSRASMENRRAHPPCRHQLRCPHAATRPVGGVVEDEAEARVCLRLVIQGSRFLDVGRHRLLHHEVLPCTQGLCAQLVVRCVVRGAHHAIHRPCHITVSE
eukprot:4525434-Prymnesium_polylepis.2